MHRLFWDALGAAFCAVNKSHAVSLLVLQYVLKSLYFEMSGAPRSEIDLPVSIARARG